MSFSLSLPSSVSLSWSQVTRFLDKLEWNEVYEVMKKPPGVPVRPASHNGKSLCSGPFRGASGTQQLARLHRKGPHRLEAWRSGSVNKSRTLRAIYQCLQNIDLFFQNGSRFTKQKHKSTREIPTGVLFPQVLDSHKCLIPQSYTFGTGSWGFPKVTHLGLGAGAGAGCSWAHGPSGGPKGAKSSTA